MIQPGPHARDPLFQPGASSARPPARPSLFGLQMTSAWLSVSSRGLEGGVGWGGSSPGSSPTPPSGSVTLEPGGRGRAGGWKRRQRGRRPGSARARASERGLPRARAHPRARSRAHPRSRPRARPPACPPPARAPALPGSLAMR